MWLAVGDINGDGLEDLVIGGPGKTSSVIFFQNKNGNFESRSLMDSVEASLKLGDDTGILLFDADGDHDLDIYICSGGNEQKPGSACYQDRLYINDGKGHFKLDSSALPVNYESKSCVKAIDFDKDGDLDLFIGERVEPGVYPRRVSGLLLRNDSKNGLVKFTDVTDTFAPCLKDIGLICDAVTIDYNNDGWPDLIIAGEWMPITFLENRNGIFVNETAQSGIGDQFGWWNSLCTGDFDHDGKMDFIAGNLGDNSFFSGNNKNPVNNYFGDFDKNGTFESITTKFIKNINGEYEEYPTSSRDELVSQLPVLRRKFPTYRDLAKATVNQVFSTSDLEGALKSHANYFATSYAHSLGDGKFEIVPLPAMAQLGPVFGIVTGDFNGDGNLDMVLCGNDFGAEVTNGKLDALNGLVILGDGKGNFTSLSIQKSGIYVPGDARAIIKIKNPSGLYNYAISQNKGQLKVYTQNKLR